MSPIQDDPRDVLAFLNSLGFVGITAPQLKMFMKDLKLYRKTKQKEENEWKEKVKQKLKNKPQLCFNDVLQQSRTGMKTRHTSSSDSYTSRETSSIKIHLQYSRKDKENQQTNSYSETFPSSSEFSDNKNCYIEQLVRGEKSQEKGVQNGSHSCTILEELSRLTVRKQERTRKERRKHLDEENKKCDEEKEEERLLSKKNDEEKVLRSSRSRTRSAGTDSARTRTTQRSCSRSKSFIRPWKLAEGQQLTNKKCDPVALYHKYQQEWNKFTFPGEDNRTKLRWEIREKMLGTDPNPKPILKKSASAATLRRRQI